MHKENIKNLVDMALFLLFVFCMGMHLWSTLAHEIAGTAMLILLVVHNILNRKWYSSLSKGRYNAMRILLSVLVVLVLAVFLLMTYSSEVISHYVFVFLPNFGSPAQAHRLHLWGAYWGMVLISLHIGVHWQKFIRLGDLSSVLGVGRWMGIVAKLAGIGIAIYGVYTFVDSQCLDYLLLRNQFAMFNNNESALKFYLDYIAMLGTGIFIAHYCSKVLRKLGR